MGNSVKFKDSELVAKRWTKALMELALENDGISKEDILDDLKEINFIISESKDLSEVFANPSISQEEKQVVLEKIFKTRLMPIVYDFLITLNSKNRLGIIDAIVEEFRKELEEFKNIKRVEITSAIELDEGKKNYIKEQLAQKLQKEIYPTWNVDSGIIGGLVFNIDETVIDNSIKHRLENLKKQITKV